MTSRASPPPVPFSFAGVRAALRWPTGADMLFSAKTLLAVAIALVIGFSQDLDNPYWSVLTIYIVEAQPQSAAIRSRGLFRLGGTVAGGAIVLLLGSLFASDTGALLVSLSAVIALGIFLRNIDRTPFSYFWFSMGLTAGIIGFVHLLQPDQLFRYTTARVAESVVGILSLMLVDNLIAPSSMTDEFLDGMARWREEARRWIGGALKAQGDTAERRQEVREHLRALVAQISNLDAKAIQLPYDVVAAPARRADLNLLHLLASQLIADLATLEQWRRVRGDTPLAHETQELMHAVADWTAQPDVNAYAPLARRLDEADTRLAATIGRYRSILEHSVIQRLRTLMADWRDLSHVIDAVATRRRLPPALAARARKARPVRSTDYWVALLDILPLTLALGFTATFWYLTAWASGGNALLFSFVGVGVITMQEQRVKSGGGLLVLIGIVCALVFFYQFAILPRVTAFPPLMAVLAVVLFPFGLLMRMSPVGLLLAAWTFSFLGLQDVYAGDFGQSLLSLGGTVVGLLIAVAALLVCDFDRTRLIATRLDAAVRRDIADAARCRRAPDPERFRQLTVDRFALFFQRLDMLPPDDPLGDVDVIRDLRAGINLITLRQEEPAMDAAMQADLIRVRDTVAAMFDRPRTAPVDNGPALDALDAMLARIGDPVPGDRSTVVAALLGLRYTLRAYGAPAPDRPEGAASGEGEVAG